jgi:TonB family protein
MRPLAVMLLVLIAVGSAFPRLGAAQTITPASCTFDTSAHLGVDSLLISLAPGSRIANKRELWSDYLLAADAIRQHYRTPERVRLPLWARLTGDSMHTGYTADDPGYGFDGEIRFRLDTVGRLANDSVVIATLAEDLAASVADAIRRADSAGAFAPPSKRLRKDRGMIRLHFALARAPSGPGRAAIPLLRVVVPTVRVDHPPRVESMPPLRYPDGLRRAGISGRVVLQVVVGVDGRPVLHTLSIVQGDYRDFLEATVEVVSGTRFKPAAIEQCDVPALVRIPFDFKIKR